MTEGIRQGANGRGAWPWSHWGPSATTTPIRGAVPLRTAFAPYFLRGEGAVKCSTRNQGEELQRDANIPTFFIGSILLHASLKGAGKI